MHNIRLATVVFLLVFISHLAFAEEVVSVFPKTQVEVKQKVYPLEYADTFELRAQGLMHRESMCENCGMLFKFQRSKIAGMWMKNTLISLDIAFIRADGKITDIKTMKAHDLTTTSASEPVLYAWEMNKGWFSKNAILVGDKVNFAETK